MSSDPNRVDDAVSPRSVPNVPPADELAEVRSKLKELSDREAELRAVIMSDPSARTGNRFLATVREVTQDRIDLKEMRACNPEIVAEFTYPLTVVRVLLNAVDPETGEITSLPRKRR